MSVWVEILEAHFFYKGVTSHAPRERVSWNVFSKILLDVPSGHAPRERVSWNSCASLSRVSRCSSRSTWACELKYARRGNSRRNLSSRSTWACELKCTSPMGDPCAHWSRSTWACELKSVGRSTPRKVVGHAPRERVSWNDKYVICGYRIPVTLHVSVWVEIWQRLKRFAGFYVTLHVSVWVEIIIIFKIWTFYMSRSTWACELKCSYGILGDYFNPSRSTWACELKFLN